MARTRYNIFHYGKKVTLGLNLRKKNKARNPIQLRTKDTEQQRKNYIFKSFNE